MIIYSINQHLQLDTNLLTMAGRDSIVINPMIGYDEDVAPIFLYQYTPQPVNHDTYYIHRDMVWYTILDISADRGLRIRNKIIELLNQADNIQSQDIDGTYGRLLYMNLVRSAEKQPLQPEGYYQFSSLFEFSWIPND